MSRPRRHFSATEKVLVLKRHLLEKAAISDLCDELGLYPNLVYAWLKEFFENGQRAFENGRKSKAAEDAKDRQIQQLYAQLQRRNQVVAELAEEYTLLKQRLTDCCHPGTEKRNP